MKNGISSQLTGSCMNIARRGGKVLGIHYEISESHLFLRASLAPTPLQCCSPHIPIITLILPPSFPLIHPTLASHPRRGWCSVPRPPPPRSRRPASLSLPHRRPTPLPLLDCDPPTAIPSRHHRRCATPRSPTPPARRRRRYRTRRHIRSSTDYCTRTGSPVPERQLARPPIVFLQPLLLRPPPLKQRPVAFVRLPEVPVHARGEYQLAARVCCGWY